MDTVLITKVARLSDGRLGVWPAVTKAMYQYIYREAAGVYWDDALGCFHSTIPREWTSSDWYRQIVSVVHGGVGLRMRLSPATVFDADVEGFRDDIIAADTNVQCWLDDTFPNTPSTPK